MPPFGGVVFPDKCFVVTISYIVKFLPSMAEEYHDLRDWQIGLLWWFLREPMSDISYRSLKIGQMRERVNTHVENKDLGAKIGEIKRYKHG